MKSHLHTEKGGIFGSQFEGGLGESRWSLPCGQEPGPRRCGCSAGNVRHAENPGC